MNSCLVHKTHASKRDPSQTPVAARPSMVLTASELSMEECPAPSPKLLFLPPTATKPTAFSHSLLHLGILYQRSLPEFS